MYGLLSSVCVHVALGVIGFILLHIFSVRKEHWYGRWDLAKTGMLTAMVVLGGGSFIAVLCSYIQDHQNKRVLTLPRVRRVSMVLAMCLITGVAMAGEQIPAGAAAVIKNATTYANDCYREVGDNKTIFGLQYGMNGQPWCGMFISSCFDEAGLVKLVAAQSEKGFASCSIALKWFTDRKQIVPVDEARAGDIVFFHFGSGTRANHVGIVIENRPDKNYMITCEGNTSDPKGSQRDGDGVYVKTRKYGPVVAVARPKYPKEH